MNYIIETYLSDIGWERSWAFPNVYTKAGVQDLLADNANKFVKSHQWRIVPLTPKPYRRHAAVTPLELRGAKQMLTNAIEHIVRNARASKCGPCDANYFAPYCILSDARVAVMRHLETL
jgi:hypothetical protein